LPAFQNDTASTNAISPTPLVKPAATRGFSKENEQAEFQGRRTLSAPAAHVFPSQVFHDPTFNPLYNHAHARSFVYGEQYPNYGQSIYGQKQGSGQPSSLQGNLNPAGPGFRAGPQGHTSNSTKDASGKNMHPGM
jgi:hypothetical protein